MWTDPRVAGRTAKNFGSITKVTYGLTGNDANLARLFSQEVAKRSLQAQSKIAVLTKTVSKPLVLNTVTPSPVVSSAVQRLAIVKGVASVMAIATLAEVGLQTIAAAGEMSQSSLSAAEAGLKSAQASERLAEAKLEQALRIKQIREQRQRDKQKGDQEKAINRALGRRIPSNDLPLGHPNNPFSTGQTATLMIQILEENGTPRQPDIRTFQNVLAVRVVRPIFYLQTFQYLHADGNWYSSNMWWRPADDTSHNGAFGSPPLGYLVTSSITIGGKTYTGTPAEISNPPYTSNDGYAPPANDPPTNFKPPVLGKTPNLFNKSKSKSPIPRIPREKHKQENPTSTSTRIINQKPDLPISNQPSVTASTQKSKSFIEINGQKIFLDDKQSFIKFGNIDLSDSPKTPSYIEFANGKRVEISGKRINLENKPNKPNFIEVNGIKIYFTQENQPSFIEINGVRMYLPSVAPPSVPVTTPTTPKSPEKQDEEKRAIPFSPITPNIPTETPKIPLIPPHPINPVQPNMPIPIPNTTPINPTQPTFNPSITPNNTPNSTPTNPPPNLQDVIQLTSLAVSGIDLLKQRVNEIKTNTSPEAITNAVKTGSCQSLKDANCTTPLKDAIVNQLLNNLPNLIGDNSGLNFESISITYKVCDSQGNETTQTEIIQIPANNKGSLEHFVRALFNAINSLHDCPSDAILALPEWYQQKEKGDIPQAAVLLRDTTSKSYWTFHIPHYCMSKDFTPVLPSFVKGSFYGKLKLKDGSRVLIYAKNKTEVQKVFNAVIPLIDPLMLTSPLDITYGEKQGASLKEVEVKPVRIMYYSKGLKDTKPDWIIYLD